jgi:hypothetical protein
MAKKNSRSRERSTCPTALDGEHRWAEPKRASEPGQLSLGFAQCTACGAVLWKSSGYIDHGLNAAEDARRS